MLLTLFAALAAASPFDYVIVGAGTCGLLLANRLSRDPRVSVAVIDPGADQRGNAAVGDPAAWGRLLGSPVDWAYRSVPQPHAAGRVLRYSAGKGIGGTSLINGMAYIRGDRAQLDAWEELGNAGWNWSALLPYYERVERFFPPEAWQVAAGASRRRDHHGGDGDLGVGFSPRLHNGSLYGSARAAWAALGQPVNDDAGAAAGHTRGFGVWPQTLDPRRNLRWDAATAFLWPVLAGRPNLRLLNGTASRVLWRKGRGAEASGVEYVGPDGRRRTARAAREVVLSAGALRTPLILERSGVGDARLLRARGIELVVDSPGVGENMMDQTNVPLALASRVAHNGTTPYATFVTARDLFGAAVDDVAARAGRSLRRWAEERAARAGGVGVGAAARERVLGVQHALVFGRGATVAEILTTAPGDTLASACVFLLPFSRGSVHVGDGDGPAIDPGFLSADVDAAAQVAAARLAARFWATAPVAGLVAGPPRATPPAPAADAPDEPWARWTAGALRSNSHAFGTAAMMARELGGVVDPALRVFGARRLHVVDASVLPMQLSGHPTATLYAVAERAAAMMGAAA